MIDEKKLDEAAKAEVMRANSCSLDEVGEFATDINLFKSGARWALANVPKPETGDDEKDPFAFFGSPWWKDMEKKLCADGWPTMVVALNCFVRDAKEAFNARARYVSPELSELIAVAKDWLAFEERSIKLHGPYEKPDIPNLMTKMREALRAVKGFGGADDLG